MTADKARALGILCDISMTEFFAIAKTISYGAHAARAKDATIEGLLALASYDCAICIAPRQSLLEDGRDICESWRGQIKSGDLRPGPFFIYTLESGQLSLIVVPRISPSQTERLLDRIVKLT
jgi:hypothetical protein